MFFINKINVFYELMIIVVLLVGGTALIAVTGWDMQLARQFYVPGSGFPTGNLQPWRALYRYGEWPAFLMAGSALLVVTCSFFWKA